MVQQANSKGVPVKVSDNINLKINMVGTISNPQIKTGLSSTGTDLATEVKQQAAVFAKQATDSVKRWLMQNPTKQKISQWPSRTSDQGPSKHQQSCIGPERQYRNSNQPRKHLKNADNQKHIR
jgi:hypothetical protein